ncbi:uncharacterized protein LOC111250145 isoform X2 [Varroa destructor]|nr:uncharacterized protein LOC111250145 isoform X2 [Varroa destructor]
MEQETIAQHQQLTTPAETLVCDLTKCIGKETANEAAIPQPAESEVSSSRYSTASSKQPSMTDVFDNIRCPNTFDDNSQIDKYFDSHNSTPSPKLRRSKRIAKKESGVEALQLTKAQAKSDLQNKDSTTLKTPLKEKDTVNDVGGKKKAPKPLGDLLLKRTSTPGPVRDRSLLKMALGNAARKLDTASTGKQRPSALGLRRRVGPRTSTPKQSTRIIQTSKANLIKKGQDKTPLVIAEEAGVSPKKPNIRTTKTARPTVIHTTSIRPQGDREQVKKTIVVLKPNALIPRRSVGLQNAGPAATVRSRRTQPATNVNNKVTTVATSKPPISRNDPPKAMTQSISQRMAPRKSQEPRKSLKSIVRSRESTSSRTKASAVRGVAKTVASLRGKTSLKKENIELIPHRPARSESIACKPARVTRNYKHVLSKVAQMINSGPAAPSAPKLKDLKSAVQTTASAKPPRKPLHDKPFLPAGKVHHETTFNVTSGNLTIAGQTMAQFVKNFHYQTPPRYRTLKPGENFTTTCDNRNPIGANPTIPKAPKFATNARLRKTIVKK